MYAATKSSRYLRGEQHDLDRMRAGPNADQSALEDAQVQLLWDARIFDDRKASLMTVCETPVLIEQRLGAVTRLIEKAMEQGAIPPNGSWPAG